MKFDIRVFFPKSAEKIQAWLKSEKNNVEPNDSMIRVPSVFLGIRNVSQKKCKENRNTGSIYEIIRKSMIESEWPLMTIRSMLFVFWINKATDANKLNKQSRTADEVWSSSLGVGRGANNTSLSNSPVKKYSHAGCFLWRQNNPEVNYYTTQISGGRGCF